jgi:large subunit ribosomal protein L23
MAEIHDIILRPLVNEKASQLEAQGTYVFAVGLDANKHQIREAVEHFFKVNVEDVRTVIVRGKFRRYGRFTSRRADWKKAYVRLAEGNTLNFLEN